MHAPGSCDASYHFGTAPEGQDQRPRNSRHAISWLGRGFAFLKSLGEPRPFEE
jgi:hypothetical protein